jgi:signal transduction histidine kinase
MNYFFFPSALAAVLCGHQWGIFFMLIAMCWLAVLEHLRVTGHVFDESPPTHEFLSNFIAIACSCGLMLFHVYMQSTYVHLLQKSQQAAIASEKATANFVAVMSHEIRSPLFSVLNFTSMTLNDHEHGLSANQRDWLETAQDSGLILKVPPPTTAPARTHNTRPRAHTLKQHTHTVLPCTLPPQ